MSQKRQPEDGKRRSDPSASSSSSTADDKRQKTSSFRNVVLEVMKLHAVQNFMEPILEPLIRRVVKEEVDLALRKHLSNIKRGGKEMHPSESRSLQLQFLNAISLPVFTGTRIEGDEGTSLRVALLDALTEQVVSTGPESTVKVEIVVLEGDFDADEENNWMHEEFKTNIVREREGKKPLLTGDVYLNLKEGTGTVGEISFTDNSSWTRSRKFRLGARVVDNCDGISIKEAKTESFIVRDHRGELYKKHHPPSLSDEVWRLEKIGKDGAFHRRLTREKVNTVKDFLLLLYLDPMRLRNILGSGMSAKMWEITVDHARTCVLDKRLYLYFPPGSQPRNGVVFNVVGQMIGLLSDSEFVPTDKLSETEKADADSMVKTAFGNWGEVVSFDDDAFLVGGSSYLSDVVYPSNSPMTGSADGSKMLTSHKIGGCEHPQQCDASLDFMPSIYSLGSMSCLDDYIDSMDVTFEPPLNLSGQVANSLLCDADSISKAFCDDEHLQFFDTDYPLQNDSLRSETDLQSVVNGCLSSCSSIKKAQRRWRMLFSVLRWFSISRIVARKAHQGLLPIISLSNKVGRGEGGVI